MSSATDGAAQRDPFFVAPYSAQELRFHIGGAAANGLLCLGALSWLAVTWQSHGLAWWGMALAVLLGVYVADLVSGLLHWAFDTWFHEDIGFIRRMVLQVREHHVHPARIFAIHFAHDAGTLSWIALLLTAPLIGWAIGLAGAESALGAGAIITSCVFSGVLVIMLETHKCGHRARNPRWVRALQRAGLLLTVAHHSRHHGGGRDFNYCIVNGWADRTLGRLGLFRALEWMISRLTGAVPRQNDHDWLRRFPRPTTTSYQIRSSGTTKR